MNKPTNQTERLKMMDYEIKIAERQLRNHEESLIIVQTRIESQKQHIDKLKEVREQLSPTQK